MSFSGSGAEELRSMTVRPPGLQTHTWVSPESSISKVRFLVILHRHLPRRVLFQRCKLQKFYTNIITQLYFVQAEAESMKLYLLTSLQPLPLIGSSAAENNCSHTLCCILELAIIHGQYQGFLLFLSFIRHDIEYNTCTRSPDPANLDSFFCQLNLRSLFSVLCSFLASSSADVCVEMIIP